MIENDISTKLVQAYNRMLERVKAAVEHAEKDTLPNLQRHIEAAKKTAVELGELTRDEAEKIGAYIKRDVQDAAEHARQTGRELADWLRFDIKLIEARLAEMFALLVDRTRVELDRLGLEAKAGAAPETLRHTGEITGVGTLYCTACGQPLHFHTTAHIPPCPKCHGTTFRRKTT